MAQLRDRHALWRRPVFDGFDDDEEACRFIDHLSELIACLNTDASASGGRPPTTASDETLVGNDRTGLPRYHVPSYRFEFISRVSPQTDRQCRTDTVMGHLGRVERAGATWSVSRGTRLIVSLESDRGRRIGSFLVFPIAAGPIVDKSREGTGDNLAVGGRGPFAIQPRSGS